MRSIDKLALTSVICGCVALALSCLYLLALFLAMFYEDELIENLWWLLVPTWFGTTLGAIALGLAALSTRAVRSGKRRGRTEAQVDIALGVLQVFLPCLVFYYSLTQLH